MQVPLAQIVGPVQPRPPHCPYNGAVGPELVLPGAVLVVDELVGEPAKLVDDGPLLPLYPLTICLT